MQMNRLAHEKSPYLLQHKNNPVDWYPWGNEAFERARAENKPVFVSIGYSTCHWCHVMAHESFEDREVAALMNRVFVNIKIDREERPDLDHTYMEVCQMIHGNGGWPLNIIMTSDKKPFFAATYIPKRGHYGRFGMIELTEEIESSWKNDPSRYIESAETITNELLKIHQSLMKRQEPGKNCAGFFESACQSLRRVFDRENGGFGYRPKFPSPHHLLFLLQYHHRNKNDREPLAMVEKTLVEMRKGGIFDQVGYGFHRYSTDEAWLVPHFEKMLYDQATHLAAYTTAYAITQNGLYKAVAEEIVDFIIRQAQSPGGGYYSALDADSADVNNEVKEGLFYLWSYEEIKSILDEDEMGLFLKLYPVKAGGNYAEEATGKSTGLNILHLESTDALAELLTDDSGRLQWQRIRQKLYQARSSRIPPQTDDKILTSWNGLVIQAMALASALLSNPRADSPALASAQKAAAFVSKNLLNRGASFHRYRDSEAAIEANLEDYAFYIFGLLQLYHATAEIEHLIEAQNLTGEMTAKFSNEKEGGFFFISELTRKNENLVLRPQDFYDGAMPCSNSVAFYDMIMLKKYTGATDFDEAIEKTIAAYHDKLQDNPTGGTFFLIGLDLYQNPSMEIVINSQGDDPRARQAVETIKSAYRPGMVYHWRTPQNQKRLSELVPFTAEMEDPSRLSFYVCQNYSCRQPIYDPEEFLKAFSEPG